MDRPPRGSEDLELGDLQLEECVVSPSADQIREGFWLGFIHAVCPYNSLGEKTGRLLT